MASTNDHGTPDPQVTPRSTGPRRYSAEYKARILAEYETLDRQGKEPCCAGRACTRH
ncbi:hypothetical protein C9F11_44420 (plasmid) [Streptomyces sp. YIM 121038]|nr:hypothetical protein C9F11_44420 [Streptomyces sp. YIM 121038]